MNNQTYFSLVDSTATESSVCSFVFSENDCVGENRNNLPKNCSADEKSSQSQNAPVSLSQSVSDVSSDAITDSLNYDQECPTEDEAEDEDVSENLKVLSELADQEEHKDTPVPVPVGVNDNPFEYTKVRATSSFVRHTFDNYSLVRGISRMKEEECPTLLQIEQHTGNAECFSMGAISCHTLASCMKSGGVLDKGFTLQPVDCRFSFEVDKSQGGGTIKGAISISVSNGPLRTKLENLLHDPASRRKAFVFFCE